MPTYELHTLGWRAFQDLCAAVLREVWGQTVQSFADSRDGGRDGAFHGAWHDTTKIIEVPEGPFVLQCKFLARRDQTLTLSTIHDELSKVGPLVKRGLCNSYVLMSNARVTGSSEAAIRLALLKEGVAHPLVLAGNWLNQTIAMNQRLRMFVPRVYGLGDLSKILDERAYEQAKALLDYLQEDLSTFVVTDAYRRAAKAIEDHGFCLLLGEPAVGKSVIAATLAMTALDQWQSPTIKIDDPADIVTHWDPNEPNQFFWADDAFGQIRHEPALTYDWARRLPKIMAAIKGGAKVVVTSRDYIYRAAKPALKEYAYPLLHEHQVVIDVAELTQDERRQIVYNHIRLGDQSREFRIAIKPYLNDAADQEPFRPEVARRLGNQSYTKGLQASQEAVRAFMARPNQFLQDVYEGLDADHIGALAMVYQAGELPVPLGRPTAEHADLLALIGSTYDQVAAAFPLLEGTFLRRSPKPGTDDLQEYWTFRHPTLREGFAAFTVNNPNWLEIFILGLDDDGILTQLDCGSGDIRGTLIAVPSTLYRVVAERVAKARSQRLREGWWERFQRWATFLANRCSRSFLEMYLEVDQQALERCLRFGSYLSAVPELLVLAKLHSDDLLSEEYRMEVVKTISDLAVETPDADWLEDGAAAALLTDDERAAILERVKAELILDLSDVLWNWKSNEQGESADEYYYPLEGALKLYAEIFKDDEFISGELRNAIQRVDHLREEAAYWQGDEDYSPSVDKPLHGVSTSVRIAHDVLGRDVFEDVDE